MFVAVVFFFFFKQKTAYEMRISDWSSDVCSSDLLGEHVRILRAFTGEQQAQLAGRIADTVMHAGARLERLGVRALDLFDRLFKLFAKVVVAVADQREALRAACIRTAGFGNFGQRDRKSTRLNSSH